MRDQGGEPFTRALRELRARLRQGSLPPDTRLAATDLAAELSLSPTPVREALSRLAGEGLLEDRRGQGFFVRRLARRDIAVLYRLSEAHLALALTVEAAAASDAPMPPPDPVLAIEHLFTWWVGRGGVRALTLSFTRLQNQLAPVRRLEPRLLPDLDLESGGLWSAVTPAERLRQVRQFHRRRVRLADRLADLLDRGGAPDERRTL
jgi:DNA-binding transcriptional regulator YhcF (GntR family)